jgi:hypothetical protein
LCFSAFRIEGGSHSTILKEVGRVRRGGKCNVAVEELA